MNHNDYAEIFGWTNSPEQRADLVVRQQQLEAQRKDEHLMAEINYIDRAYVAGLVQIPFVTRDCNYAANVAANIFPIAFTRN